METDDHPPRSSSQWDNPDLCPFCGANLVDGGAGFIDHTKESEPCSERFEAWLTGIRDDMGGEWGG